MNTYQKIKTGKMSREQALKISNELLETLSILYRANTMQPLKLTTSINTGIQTKTRIICNLDDTIQTSIERYIYKNSEDYHRDNVYLLVWKNRVFDITFYNSPEDCGYYSLLPSYDNETYIFCIIKELRPYDKTKYQISFGFDIEKNSFIELFDIDHHNINGFIRKAGDSIEEELKGRCIF